MLFSFFARARVLTLAVLVFAACGACDNSTDLTIPDPEATPPGWSLVWADEFDGMGLDASKWEFQIGDGCPDLCGWGNNELQSYQRENLSIRDGMLTITARQETDGSFTSSRVRTKGQGDWTFGRFEIRARLPTGQGLWPAIWLLPTDEVYGGWAASGEIDIMEAVGHKPAEVFGTLHYGDTFPNNVFTGTEFELVHGTFADDFFVFALEWEAGEIRWYINNVLYQTQTAWRTTSGDFPAPFDQAFHLILNVAVGGNLPGAPDETTVFPQQMVVDYVRVYQRDA